VANNPLNAVDPLGLLLSDCVSCNFFNNALSAVNQTINWSVEAQTRDFFGDKFDELPGKNNEFRSGLSNYLTDLNGPHTTAGEFDLYAEMIDSGGPSWWGTFAQSFFGDFSLKSARQRGERFTTCLSRVRAAGGAFTTAVDAVTLGGAATSLASAPSLIKTSFPLSQDLFLSAGSFGRTIVSTSFLERAAMEASIVYGSLPASSVRLAQRGAAVLSKGAGIVTAVGAGLELGSLGACR